MPRTIVVHCPAKVNLFLAVGPKDARGYHPLRTIFQAIDLCDALWIEIDAKEPGFFCDDASVPADNTVTRALALLREIAPLPPLRIKLVKRIPSESGLGGGSSDAAGLLRAAKHLVQARLPDAELLGIAKAVGADVPFFLVGGRAKATGYGDLVEPQEDQPVQWLVVARPNVGCPTPAMYRRLDDIDYDWRDFPSDGWLYNDFVRVAPHECRELIQRLKTVGAEDATLSGSGSAVFGLFASEEAARHAANQIQAPFVRVVRTLTRAESLAMRCD